MKIGIDARNLVTKTTGISRYVQEMTRQLALAGHEIFLYIPERPNAEPIKASNVRVRVSNFAGGPRRMIWAQTVLTRQASRDDIDVFWGPAHRLPFYLDRKIARVVTIHDLVWRDQTSTMRLQTRLADQLLMKPAANSADRIVVDSIATGEALCVLSEKYRNKLRVIYPGITELTGATQPDTVPLFGIDRPYILFVGTLEPRKNLKKLLEAYSLLPDEVRRDLLLVLAGGQGWRLHDLEQHIANLNLQGSVRLTGYVSDQQLSKLYQNAEFLAMPSLYEGFGFPIVEANAAGVPVLTSNISSMPEVGGTAAFFVDPNDVRSIAAGLKQMATDPLLREKLAQASLFNARRFDWNLSASRLQEVFNDAIALRARSNRR
ncbi:glycosyltransferase family 1 protein [Rhizobium sp. NXC24]|uniref:glycosyltransferase family 4 protein n=1 Tax=Rhizobium sp. NXC24 TaxID=2048897 RepID=UPI000CDF428B|nr:glycosyltransferase family 1 protein [Rhizobium sp. NXC24]AVA25753.1 glycosyltransferase family 1 protein [Rhizobium sp. NXC24]